MSVHSPNVKVMISAVNLASKAIIRDFYEMSKLQNSRNHDGVKKFTEKACDKSYTIMRHELEKYNTDIGFQKEDNTECYWRLQPIDGLYNFSRSIPYFAIAISLIKNEEVIAIAIDLPVFKETIWAEKTVGAYIEDGGTTTKLRLNKSKPHSNIPLIALSGINGTLFRALQGMQYRIMGSMYVGMAYVATSRIDSLLLSQQQNAIDSSLLIKEAWGIEVKVDKYCILGNAQVATELGEKIKNG